MSDKPIETKPDLAPIYTLGPAGGREISINSQQPVASATVAAAPPKPQPKG